MISGRCEQFQEVTSLSTTRTTKLKSPQGLACLIWKSPAFHLEHSQERPTLAKQNYADKSISTRFCLRQAVDIYRRPYRELLLPLQHTTDWFEAWLGLIDRVWTSTGLSRDLICAQMQCCSGLTPFLLNVVANGLRWLESCDELGFLILHTTFFVKRSRPSDNKSWRLIMLMLGHNSDPMHRVGLAAWVARVARQVSWRENVPATGICKGCNV